jgi:hypothetical protein
VRSSTNPHLIGNLNLCRPRRDVSEELGKHGSETRSEQSVPEPVVVGENGNSNEPVPRNGRGTVSRRSGWADGQRRKGVLEGLLQVFGCVSSGRSRDG